MKENTVPARQEQKQPAPETREEQRTLTPPVNIFETGEGLVVVADLPGVTKEQVSVDVADSLLTIKAAPAAKMQGDPVLQEFALLPYFRQFQLSDAVDQEKIRAEMKHGVLSVYLPKVAAKQPKKIEVAVAS